MYEHVLAVDIQVLKHDLKGTLVRFFQAGLDLYLARFEATAEEN